MSKILLVNNDITPAGQALCQSVRAAGHNVDQLDNVESTIEYVLSRDCDLIICSLPMASCLNILKTYRASGRDALFSLLVHPVSVSESVEAFECGADEVMTLPINIKELLARTQALLRRSKLVEDKILCAGGIELNLSQKVASVDGQTVQLSPKECQFLALLLKYPDKFFTTEQLLKQLWNLDSEVDESAVRTLVRKLRHKIDPQAQRIISLRGHGYSLASKIQPHNNADGNIAASCISFLIRMQLASQSSQTQWLETNA